MKKIRWMKRAGKCAGCDRNTLAQQIDPYREELYGGKVWIYLHDNEDCVRTRTDEI